MMKQIVAARRVGIIRTPNQPTYSLLLVDVTQEQKFSQVDAPCWRVSVEAILLKRVSYKCRDTGYIIPPPPSGRGIRDFFEFPVGLGLRGM